MRICWPTWMPTPAPTTSSWRCRSACPRRSRPAARCSNARSPRCGACWPTPTWWWSGWTRPATWRGGSCAPTKRVSPDQPTRPAPGPWPCTRNGTGCGWTACGTPPSGWPNGPVSRCAATSWPRSCLVRRGPCSRWSWSRWAPKWRHARSRRRARPTWPTPSCVAGAASCRRRAGPASPRSWRGVKPSSPRATRRSGTRGSSPCRPPRRRSWTAACDTVQHAAGQSRLALRRLYGDQSWAYTCTLPLARGLQ